MASPSEVREEKAVGLADRSAIITGASRGLGQAIAARFVAEGASVLMVAREEGPLQSAREGLERLAVRKGQVVHAFPGDVSRGEDCRAVAEEAGRLFPELTILVNNAGVYGPMGRVEEVDWEHWLEAVRINLFGTVLMCRAVIPSMRRRGYGKIINLSGGGATTPLPFISAYAASKAAVARLTETFAEELREAGVDVNAVAPGALDTRLLDQVLAAGPERVGAAFYQRSLKLRQEGATPLDEGAALAVFLASAGSDGITGRLISAVWDDWASLPARWPELKETDAYTLRRVVPAASSPDHGGSARPRNGVGPRGPSAGIDSRREPEGDSPP